MYLQNQKQDWGRFIPVATKGTLKTLLPQLVEEIGVQAAFVNTYHLVSHPGVDLVEKAGGIHQFSQLRIPLMSDSGGFQVFSLAATTKNNHQIRKADIHGDEQPLVLKISDEGVKFRSTHDGQLLEFTPEKSVEYQIKIGADLLMAFDECTYYPATYKYAKKAMERTHKWLIRCLKGFQARYHVFRFIGTPLRESSGSLKSSKQVSSLAINYPPAINNHQFLYGIIQGGTFEDLRKKSAEFVVSQPVDGIAIGGVAVGESKKEMREQVKWVADYLPNDKPVHLLGIGQFDDILHHLFKQKEILGHILATYHNLFIMERFFDRIRELIKESRI